MEEDTVLALNIESSAFQRVLMTLEESKIVYSQPSSDKFVVYVRIKNHKEEERLKKVLKRAQTLLTIEAKLEELYNNSPNG